MSREEVVNNFKPKEEKSMTTFSNRRTVTVEVFDNDKGLPVEHSLVMRVKNVVTEDTDEITIREVLMRSPVAKKLQEHNEKRTNIVNEDILNRTGNEVYLRPVKLKDLTWVVK